MRDANSLATLADVKRGGVLRHRRVKAHFPPVQVGKGRPLYCRRSWEFDHTL